MKKVGLLLVIVIFGAGWYISYTRGYSEGFAAQRVAVSQTPTPAPADQWILESYEAQKGYVFRKDDVHYQAECWAVENGAPPEGRVLLKGADTCVEVLLPYMRKAIPLEQPVTRTMWDSPDMLFFTESKTGLKYILTITSEK